MWGDISGPLRAAYLLRRLTITKRHGGRTELVVMLYYIWCNLNQGRDYV